MIIAAEEWIEKTVEGGGSVQTDGPDAYIANSANDIIRLPDGHDLLQVPNMLVPSKDYAWLNPDDEATWYLVPHDVAVEFNAKLNELDAWFAKLLQEEPVTS